MALGCAKNLVDSERILGQLASDGYVLSPDPEGADFVVVNTCGFIQAARDESLSVLREMASLKRTGRIGALFVAGCLAERLREQLMEEVPEIDGMVGVFSRDDLKRLVRRHLEGLREQRAVFRPAPTRPLDDRVRLRITPRHFAYLKISEGCDRLCTFCSIPRMRGRHVSKPIEQILAEAEELARDGVHELILVAQDTTYYGIDLYGEPCLARLLRELERSGAFRWIRLLYCYPQHFSDELIETVAQSDRILPYIDLPLQHINDRLLRRMKRQVTRSETIALLERLRASIPDLVLRTTFIVGFPGETDAEFEELCDFVRAARFERLGVFTYSLEPDTPAARLPDHLPEELKQARRDRLMEVQQRIAFEWARQQVGRRLEVLIDRVDEEPGWWVGRSYADAPDIDGVVYVHSQTPLRPGQFVPVTITEADGYDLVGTVAEPAGAIAARRAEASETDPQ